MPKEDGFTIKEEKKTVRELLRSNEWVFRNPILMLVVNEAPSAKQADKRIKKMFSALPAVNKIAKTVRRITHLRIISKKETWQDLSKPDGDYQPVDMFVLLNIPKITEGRLSFSSGINFYPPENNSGLFKQSNLPDIFKEATDGMHTSISNLASGNSPAEIKSVDSKDLLLVDDSIKMHKTNSTKAGKFDVRAKEFSYQTHSLPRITYAMHYNYLNANIGMSNQVVIASPEKGDIYSTVYRKISIYQDLGLHDSNPLSCADSIVVLLDMGIAVKDDSHDSIGKVIFRRKHFLDKNHDYPITLIFEYAILPNLKLRPWHEKLGISLPNYIYFDYQYPNLAITPDVGYAKIAGNITTELLSKFCSISPYEKEKPLNLQEMFGDFLTNPPDEIITLFK